jgi:hypothetical protein
MGQDQHYFHEGLVRVKEKLNPVKSLKTVRPLNKFKHHMKSNYYKIFLEMMIILGIIIVLFSLVDIRKAINDTNIERPATQLYPSK